MARNKAFLGTAALITGALSLLGSLTSAGINTSTQKKIAKKQELANNYQDNIETNTALNQQYANLGLDSTAQDELNNKVNNIITMRCGGRKKKSCGGKKTCRTGGQQFFDRLEASKIINRF